MDWLAAFRTRYPQFDTVVDDIVQAVINEALLQVSQAVWGTLYEAGVLALTCHELTLDNPHLYPGGMTDATSRKVGDVQINFRSSTDSTQGSDYYNRTRCGQKYWQWLGMVGMGAVAVPVTGVIK